MHNIYNQYGHITEIGTSRSKIGERLMPWCINDLISRNLQFKVDSALASLLMFLKCRFWEVGSTNLLSNTTGLTGLYVCASKFIQNEGFSCIDVTQDTDNWTSQFLLHILLSLKSVLLSLVSLISLGLNFSKSLLLSQNLLLSLGFSSSRKHINSTLFLFFR